MTPEEIKEYTGNDDGCLIGYISELEKNKFYGIFERKNNTSIQLEHKNKKLTLQQKGLLKLGRIITLNFNTGKLHFMNEQKQWI